LGTKTLESIFVILLLAVIVISVAIFMLGDPKEDFVEAKEYRGSFQSFEVSHEKFSQKYKHMKTTDRYDKKLLEYLDHRQKARDKTFFR